MPDEVPAALRTAARLHILFEVFDGDIESWRIFHEKRGELREAAVARHIEARQRQDPSLKGRLRAIYKELTDLDAA